MLKLPLMLAEGFTILYFSDGLKSCLCGCCGVNRVCGGCGKVVNGHQRWLRVEIVFRG